MFDFLRNLTKNEEERQQERLSAYLDNALTPQERAAFEEQLGADTALRADLEQQRLVKENIGQLPRLHAPRNFTLDPAAYGRPAPQPALRLYPVMQAATALAAIMLIFLFSVDLFSTANERTETAAEAPIALSNVTREGETEVASQAADTDVEEAAPAPEVGLPEEPAAEEPAAEAELALEESAEEAHEPVEEAVEEEMMAEEVAEEAELAEEAAAPAAESGFTADNTTAAEATEMPPAVTAEGEAQVAGGDGTTATQALELTPTPGISPVTTLEPGQNSFLYSRTTTISETEPALDNTSAPTLVPVQEQGTNNADQLPSLPTIRLLQIGLGILFLILLAATWLLRRQL